MHESLIDQVAFTSRAALTGPVRALVLRFEGLGCTNLKKDPDMWDLDLASRGGLVITPFHNPWSWMNDATRTFVDELVDAVLARHALAATTPIVATGGSMGGHGALVYAMYTRHRLAGCMANCPPASLVAHYGERPDLPRTMHSAFGSYGDITAELERHSPVHHPERLPKIPYLIVQGVHDAAVSKTLHSDVLVPRMRQLGLDVDYQVWETMGHCGPMTGAQYRSIIDWIARRWTA